MYLKSTLVSALAVFAVAANAAPEVQPRQIDSVFNSLTSLAGSAVTGGVGDITSVGGSIGGQITSAAGGALETVTSLGGSAASAITSGAGAVTSAGGSFFSSATSAGGSLLSSATSAGGSLLSSATSAAGSLASEATQSNAATAAPSFGFTSSHAIGLATVVCSALIGAIITF